MLAPAGTPAAVVLPRCTDDVVAVMRTASGHGIPVVPRAGAEFVNTTDDPAEGDLLLQARRMALPALEQLGSTLIDDVAVPRSRIAAFLDGCDAIASARDLVIGVVGHAGDGNMHPTICFDPTDVDQRERAFTAFDDILALGLSSAARSPASTASA